MSSLKKIAKEKYIEYSKYEGSQHIAKEHSIYRVLENIKNNESKYILEVGLGIGTIYSSVYEFQPSLKYFGTESNDFCLKSLKSNLNVPSYNHLNICPNIESLHNKEKFDLVVIDGKDSTLEIVNKHLNKNAVIIIEGDRSDQEKFIIELFPNCKSVHIITLKKNNINGYYKSLDYQGGVKVIFVNPNKRQFAYWIKHKVLTNLKYNIRKLRKKNE